MYLALIQPQIFLHCLSPFKMFKCVQCSIYFYQYGKRCHHRLFSSLFYLTSASLRSLLSCISYSSLVYSLVLVKHSIQCFLRKIGDKMLRPACLKMSLSHLHRLVEKCFSFRIFFQCYFIFLIFYFILEYSLLTMSC